MLNKISISGKILIAISSLSLLIWFILFCIKVLAGYDISVLCQNTEFFIDVVNITFSLFLYYKNNSNGKRVFRFFLLSIIFLFILDVLYYIVYSIPHKWSYVFIFDLFHFTYYAITIYFITNILTKYTFNLKNILIGFPVAILVNIGIFLVFSIDTKFIHNYWSIRNTIQITRSIIDLILFNFCFFWLIYSKKISSSIIASGYIILTASEFMLTSCYISKITSLLVWAELFWMLGLIFLLFGMVTIILTNSYDIKDWFANSTNIRIKFTFSSFTMISLSLIMFFVLIKQFATINEEFYVFFPTIIMVSSLIVALISIFIGRTVEKPLIDIQNDINNLLVNNNTVDDFKIANSEQYSETQQIEQKIKTLILLVNKQSKNAAIGILARDIAHDIKSPLSILQYCKDTLSNIIEVDEKLLKSIKIAIDSIKYILVNLLNLNIKHYSGAYNSSEITHILFNQLIDDIVVQKSIEYHNKCEFNFTNNTDSQLLWLFINQNEFKNKIANLISNAFEAVEANTAQKLINFSITNDKENVYIKITDNGCGIEPIILEKVKSGYTTKINGNGIGLKSAIDFFDKNNGKLLIESIPNHCTTVDIQIKLSPYPKWFTTKISLLDHIVVLDDDLSIHYYIQSKLSAIFKIKYFTQISEFKEWVNNNKDMIHITTYFIDYYIEDGNKSGVEIINQFNINTTSYLLTNEYSIKPVQEEVIKSNIKMLPKSLINLIDTTVN